MPAYNAARTIRRTIDELPLDVVDEIICVDDFSRDGTVDVAVELGLTTIQHNRNFGYGGSAVAGQMR